MCVWRIFLKSIWGCFDLSRHLILSHVQNTRDVTFPNVLATWHPACVSWYCVVSRLVFQTQKHWTSIERATCTYSKLVTLETKICSKALDMFGTVEWCRLSPTVYIGSKRHRPKNVLCRVLIGSQKWTLQALDAAGLRLGYHGKRWNGDQTDDIWMT